MEVNVDQLVDNNWELNYLANLQKREFVNIF